MDSIRKHSSAMSAFPQRPWMSTLGAAAATGEGNKGLKGIVAGMLWFNKISLKFVLYLYLPMA